MGCRVDAARLRAGAVGRRGAARRPDRRLLRRWPTMLTLLRTEMLKLTTTRWPWILVAVTLAATAVQALQPVYKSGRDGDPTLGTASAELAVLDALSRGALVALLLGVLMVTSE